MKQISVGLITNADGAHLAAYLGALAAIGEVEAVYLADASGGTVAEATQKLGAKLKGTFQDTPTMLREAKPAMALVTLEAALSPPAIAAALDAGCHVLAEKPACVQAADFAALTRKAESKHLHLMLALANRLNPSVREARRLMQTGAFGKVYAIEMHIVADQTRLKSAAYHKTWFANKARGGGGHLSWLGIHWLDLAQFITGLRVRDVTGLFANVGGQPIEVEDSAALVMRFDNGSLGTLTSGYYLDKGYHTHIKIWCEGGWLEFGGMADSPLDYYTNKVAKTERFEPPKGESGYTPFVRAAVRASAGLETPPVTAQEGLRALEVVFALYRASETGELQSLA